MTTPRDASVDDLSHEWPPDVLRYDLRFVFGLTVNDLLVIAMPTILLIPLIGLLGGLAGLVAGFLAVRRFESLGERRVTEYLAARLVHTFRDAKEPVLLPLIMPAGLEEIQITTWEGEELARIGA